MKDLLTLLREVQAGIANPNLREVAMAARDLLAKQVRQSWENRQTEDQQPWAPTKQPSFAGVLGRHMGMPYFHLLGYKETGKKRFYGQADLQPHQSESFLSRSALDDIRRATVTDNGFETGGQIRKYWAWQSDGTSKTGFGPPIPARSFWAFGDDFLGTVTDLLAARAAAKVAGE